MSLKSDKQFNLHVQKTQKHTLYCTRRPLAWKRQSCDTLNQSQPLSFDNDTCVKRSERSFIKKKSLSHVINCFDRPMTTTVPRTWTDREHNTTAAYLGSYKYLILHCYFCSSIKTQFGFDIMKFLLNKIICICQ